MATYPRAFVFRGGSGGGGKPVSFSRAQLQDMQGDLMVWCPEVKPDWTTGVDPVTGIRQRGDNGATPRGIEAGWVWTLWLPYYTPAQRQLIYAAMIRDGFTHCALSVTQPRLGDQGYHGLRPVTPDDVAHWGTWCMQIHGELTALGIVPICAGPAPGPASEGGADLANGFDGSIALVAMGDWDNTGYAAERVKTTCQTFPNALCYYERPEDKVQAWPAPSPLGGDPVRPGPGNGGAWIRGMQQQFPNFVGVLYEVNMPDGVASCAAQLNMARTWWRDVQGVRFETNTYWKFWQNYSKAQCDQFEKQLQDACPWLQGFMSGGPSHPRPVDVKPGGNVIHGTEDKIDAGGVAWEAGVNVGAFNRTCKLTRVEIRSTGLWLDFTKKNGAGRWPDVIPPNWTQPLQYSIGLCELIDGRWHGSAPIQAWWDSQNRQEVGGPIQSQNVEGTGIGQIPKNWFYDSRWGPLRGRRVQPGELVGLFVCAGDARDHYCPLPERSQIVTFQLPAPDEIAVYEWTD